MIDSDIKSYIELQSKIISHRCWSEEYGDLIQDGLVLMLEEQKANPNISKEALLRRLRNFYSAKRRKIRVYQRRNTPLGEGVRSPAIEEVPTLDGESNEKDKQLIIELVKQYGLSRKELAKILGTTESKLYNEMERKRR